MIARSKMRTLIRAWRVRHGFAFDRPRLHGTALEQMAEGARSNADFAAGPPRSSPFAMPIKRLPS